MAWQYELMVGSYDTGVRIITGASWVSIRLTG